MTQDYLKMAISVHLIKVKLSYTDLKEITKLAKTRPEVKDIKFDYHKNA